METKTKVTAEEGKQELFITREFEIPVSMLFKAYVEKEIVGHWMGTKVVKLENKRHGSYLFETTDPIGNIHRFNGTIHEIEKDQKITRTFEMENSGLPVQLEYFTFEKLTENSSKLTMQIVFKSIEFRDQLLKMPFSFGINMAHNRLEEFVSTLS